MKFQKPLIFVLFVGKTCVLLKKPSQLFQGLFGVFNYSDSSV